MKVNSFYQQHEHKFIQFLELFLETNRQINLSAIRDEAGVREKHFLDSLLPLDFYDFEGQTVMDLGSGGGFPTLPLAVACPKTNFHALDSVGKKMRVVQNMANQLDLENVKTFNGRIEDFGQAKNFREKYDTVIARALAPWPVLLEYALPFVRVGGFFLAYQGPAILDELDQNSKILDLLYKKLGAKIVQVETRTLGDNERVFVLLEKINSTPKKFPRANGVPRSKPLA